MELSRFCEMLAQGDPRAVETLFMHSSTVRYAHEAFSVLQQYRREFISKELVGKYLSDAGGSNGMRRLARVADAVMRDGGAPDESFWKMVYVVTRLLDSASSVSD